MNSSDESLNNEYRNYCLAVGHLMLAFSRIENLLTSILKLHLAMNIGTPEDKRAMSIASAVYGSMRYSAARDTIKKLLEVENTDKKVREFLATIFSQVGEIESFRNKLAHQMVVPAHSDLGRFWQVSDIVTTREIAKLRVWVFDTDAVGFAADDLILISDRLGKRPVDKTLFSQPIDLSLPTWRYSPSMVKMVPHEKLKRPPPL